MVSDYFDTGAVAPLWPNVMSILILASMTVSLLVLSPWGYDVLFSGITHFFILWPLLLLAILTYVTMHKLADEEREIPDWEWGH